jgi:hypothetical protein
VGTGEVFDPTGGRKRKNGKGMTRDVFGIWHFLALFFEMPSVFALFSRWRQFSCFFFTSPRLKCSQKILVICYCF